MRRYLPILGLLTLLPLAAGVAWSLWTGEILSWTAVSAAMSRADVPTPGLEEPSQPEPFSLPVPIPEALETVLDRERENPDLVEARGHLLFAARPHRTGSWRPVALLAAAASTWEAGDLAEAEALTSDPDLMESHLAGFALMRLGELAAGEARTEEALAAFDRAVRLQGLDPVGIRARIGRVRARIDLGQAEEALAELDDLEPLAPRWVKEDELLFLRALAYRAGGSSQSAHGALDSLYLHHPRSRFNRMAADLPWRRARARELSRSGLTPAQRIQRADAFYEAGWYVSASQTYQRVLKANPSLEDPDRVYLQAGVSTFRRRRYKDALPLLEQVGSGMREYFLQARYTIGEIHRRRRQYRDFLSEMHRVANLDGSGAWRAKAMLAVGEHLSDRDPEGAREAWIGAAEADPGSEASAEARWLLGWNAYHQYDFEAAREHFEALSRDGHHPHEMAAGLYWAGKAEASRGRRDASREYLEQVLRDYPNDFYASRAQQLLGAEMNEAPVFPPSPSRQHHLAAEMERVWRRLLPDSPQQQGLLRFRDFLATGQWDAAEAELDWLGSQLGTLPALEGLRLDLYGKKGDHLAALRAFRSAYPDFRSRLDIPREHWRAVYPKKFLDLVRESSESRGLDPDFTLAVIHQESVFDPKATSRVGARGLMQIMPATGRDLARRIGENGFSTQRLYEPELNIRFGTFYLRDLLDRFEERPELALAGYNAGSGRVRQWLESPGSEDLDVFVESIPFDETRNYVKRILNNVSLYKRLYDELEQDNRIAHDLRAR